MDPNVTLGLIETAQSKSARDSACQDLHDWMSRGGFAPYWHNRPKATRLFLEWIYRNVQG